MTVDEIHARVHRVVIDIMKDGGRPDDVAFVLVGVGCGLGLAAHVQGDKMVEVVRYMFDLPDPLGLSERRN